MHHHRRQVAGSRAPPAHVARPGREVIQVASSQLAAWATLVSGSCCHLLPLPLSVFNTLGLPPRHPKPSLALHWFCSCFCTHFNFNYPHCWSGFWSYLTVLPAMCCPCSVLTMWMISPPERMATSPRIPPTASSVSFSLPDRSPYQRRNS